MREDELARRVKHHLDLGLSGIDGRTADRLHQARETALARVTAPRSVLAVAGPFHLDLQHLLPTARRLALPLALPLAVAGSFLWSSVEQAAEYAEVDTALLADELPIDAYLDSGFDAWLRQDWRQR